MITHDELKRRLHYEPKTGLFTRLINKGPGKKGAIAGHQTHPKGYVQISVASRQYYAHRLAWFYVTGNWPKLIDHINGITSDNRFSNLRECSMSENMQNLKSVGSRINKSGHIGVFQIDGKWHSSIRYMQNGKRKKVRMGPYSTKKEAIAAYRSAKSMLHRFHPENTR